MEDTTLVTALYNIKRETEGDGRKWQDYLDWFRETLQLPFHMIIYISIKDELIEMINTFRPKQCSTKVIFQELNEIPYAFYEPQFKEIMESAAYLQKIRHPDRVECRLPFYNILQYSKFQWLKQAAQENPFKSSYIFWADAGCSRFIPRQLYTSIRRTLDLPKDRLIIQHNYLLFQYPVTEEYLWDSQCLMCGTMFGGGIEAVTDVATCVERELAERTQKGWINNEQILLAYLFRVSMGDRFYLVYNNTPHHLCIFEKLFVNSL